jgi:thioredoxin reductase
MFMSQLYDVIVIGASEEGISFCEQLLAKTTGLQVALVSRNFNRPVDIAGLTKIPGEVIFSTYNRGMIGLTLHDRTQIFGVNVVIAVGTKPVKSNLKNTNIHYNLLNIKASKTTPVVVAGNDNLAASYALALAKKFKYVYLCSNSVELNCDAKCIKKLENVANIVHLPNCNVLGCKNDKDGKLVEVQLDTYSSIRCSALVMSLGRIPDNPGLSKRMIEVDSNGYVITKGFNVTTIVPNIYAVGTCTKGGTKTRLVSVINHLIDVNGFKRVED